MFDKAIPRFQRQGDVGVTQINAGNLPAGLIQRKENALAYGEVTGHAHRIFAASPDEEVLLLEDSTGDLYVNVKGESGAYLYHGNDEQIARQRNGETMDYSIEDVHAHQFLPKGVYRVNQQKEYDPYEQVMRAAED